MSFKVYQQFDSTDIISGKDNTVSSGFFPGGVITYIPSQFVTSSVQTQTVGSGSSYDYLNGLYYINVYDNNTSNPQQLFSITYGDVDGSGSATTDLSYHTKAVYSQYRNSLLGLADSVGLFSFLSGSNTSTGTYVTGSDIFVLNFSSQLQRTQIDPGQWQISFRNSTNTADITLIDDSTLLLSNQKNQDVYEIIQGVFDSNQGKTVDAGKGYQGIGLFYPKNGIIILNASALVALLGAVGTYNGVRTQHAYEPVFHQQLYTVMSSATTLMRIRKSEIIPSSHYFIRVKNQDYNFSNNPTFIYQTSDSVHARGDILDSIVANPVTYVTTVGLYNDLNELVAVAKLSQPARKNSVTELLIRIRLDF